MAHNLILVEADGKCQWQVTICRRQMSMEPMVSPTLCFSPVPVLRLRTHGWLAAPPNHSRGIPAGCPAASSPLPHGASPAARGPPANHDASSWPALHDSKPTPPATPPCARPAAYPATASPAPAAPAASASNVPRAAPAPHAS